MNELRAEIIESRQNSAFPLTDVHGNLVGPFGLMVTMGEIGRSLASLGASLRFSGHVSHAEREAVILWVAWFRQNAFEEWAHRKVVEADRLIPADLVDALGEGKIGVVRDSIVGNAVVIADAILRHDIEQVRELSTEFSTAAQVREIICLVKYYDLLATLMAAEDIGIPEL